MIGSVIGTGPALLEGAGTNSAGEVAYLIEVFQTPLFNLTNTYSNIEIIPARPGYYPLAFNTAWIIESLSGTQTSPLTLRAGSNPGHSNIFPLQSTNPSNANVNVAVPPSIASGLTIAVPNNTQQIAKATVYMDITAPASGTGGFACTARMSFFVLWIPFGST
jgi:hypothetical protein